MASKSPKGSLPHGWIVKTSKRYPGRIYYFNIFTGCSTWECPELNPPRLLDDKEMYSKEVGTSNNSSESRLIPGTDVLENEKSNECLPQTTKTLLAVKERLLKSKESSMCSRVSGSPPSPHKSMKTIVESNKVPSTSPKNFHPSPEKVSNNSATPPRTRKEPKQSKDLFVPPSVSRKRKAKDALSSTSDTPKRALGPPTAVVTPVVVDKDGSTPKSLPSNQRAVYKNKTRQLASSSTPSTGRVIEKDVPQVKEPLMPSTSGHVKNKSPLPVSTKAQRTEKSGTRVVYYQSRVIEKDVPQVKEPSMPSTSGHMKNKSPLPVSTTAQRTEKSVSPNCSPSSTSASSSEYCDTDLDMICEPTEHSSILSEIQNASFEDIEMLDVSSDLTKIDDLAVPAQIADNCSYYIVFDTNVLIEDLSQIDELKDTPLDGCGPPHIFIPWIVIQELDGLKRSTRTLKLSRAAHQAVCYLNKVLKPNYPRFHGQSPQEAKDCAQSYSECNDDKILECCMSLAQKMPAEKVVLMTHDKNLINKALICDIVVHTWDTLWKMKDPVLVKGKSKKKKNKKKKSAVEIVMKPAEEKNRFNLTQEQDVCKREIHSMMSEARQLLKEVLLSFLTEEMNDAYGDPWNSFPINKQLLNGILDAFLRYWKTVFSLQIPEKYKRMIELLKEKTNRPEGFFGDREDCLGTLTMMEDIFCCIKRRWPKLDIPVEKVEDLRARCNDTFNKHNSIDISISQIQSEKDLSESDSVLVAFENAWTVINHLCGMMMDFYGVSHNLVYEKPSSAPSDEHFRKMMANLYPCVVNIQKLMLGVVGAIKNHNPRAEIFEHLYRALTDLVPTLQIQTNNPKVPNFSPRALENYCRDPENKDRVEYGSKQIQHFFSKLDEALKVMLSSKPEECTDSMVLD